MNIIALFKAGPSKPSDVVIAYKVAMDICS